MYVADLNPDAHPEEDEPIAYECIITVVGLAEITARSGVVISGTGAVTGAAAAPRPGAQSASAPARGPTVLGKRRDFVTFACTMHGIEARSGSFVIVYVTAAMMKMIREVQRDVALVGTTLRIRNPLHKYGPVGALTAIMLPENPSARILIERRRNQLFNVQNYPLRSISQVDGVQGVVVRARIVKNPAVAQVTVFTACPEPACDRRTGAASGPVPGMERSRCGVCTSTKIARSADALNAVNGMRMVCKVKIAEVIYGAQFCGDSLLRSFAGIDADVDTVEEACYKSVAFVSSRCTAACLCRVRDECRSSHHRFRMAHDGREIHLIGWMWSRLDDVPETEDAITLDTIARGVIHVAVAQVVPAVGVGPAVPVALAPVDHGSYAAANSAVSGSGGRGAGRTGGGRGSRSVASAPAEPLGNPPAVVPPSSASVGGAVGGGASASATAP